MQNLGLNFGELAIENAKNKLREHWTKGEKSTLSVLQVAKLIDTIVFQKTEVPSDKNIFSIN